MEIVSIYGSFFIQFPRFTYIQVGGFECQPFKLPRYTFDSFVLTKVSRQLAHIDKRLGAKGESGVVFPVKLGYYSYKLVSDALNLELEFKRMNLQPYVARRRFDSKGYTRENLNIDSHFCHDPHIENYWENCKDEHEVRKRFWSRFTLQQIVVLRLPINTSCVLEFTEEDVLNPDFGTEIEGKPIPEIDWNKKEDDNIQTRTFNVVRRSKRWLRKLKFKEGPSMSPHETGSDSHILVQSLISTTNKIVDIAGVSKPVVEKIQPRR